MKKPKSALRVAFIKLLGGVTIAIALTLPTATTRAGQCNEYCVSAVCGNDYYYTKSIYCPTGYYSGHSGTLTKWRTYGDKAACNSYGPYFNAYNCHAVGGNDCGYIYGYLNTCKGIMTETYVQTYRGGLPCGCPS